MAFLNQKKYRKGLGFSYKGKPFPYFRKMASFTSQSGEK
jgi:hypothetical protein